MLTWIVTIGIVLRMMTDVPVLSMLVVRKTQQKHQLRSQPQTQVIGALLRTTLWVVVSVENNSS